MTILHRILQFIGHSLFLLYSLFAAQLAILEQNPALGGHYEYDPYMGFRPGLGPKSQLSERSLLNIQRKRLAGCRIS
jgi:hypothetical protein